MLVCLLPLFLLDAQGPNIVVWVYFTVFGDAEEVAQLDIARLHLCWTTMSQHGGDLHLWNYLDVDELFCFCNPQAGLYLLFFIPKTLEFFTLWYARKCMMYLFCFLCHTLLGY